MEVEPSSEPEPRHDEPAVAVSVGWQGGVPAIRDYVVAISHSLRSRGEVERLRQRQRRPVEQRWAR